MEQMKKELEQAAKVILASPSLVTNEERKAASEVFALFKRTNSPYAICRYILDESEVGYVLFEVVDAIKGALIREWKLLDKGDTNSMLQYLLVYAVGRAPTLPTFVKEKLVQTIAIIIKRKSSEDDGVQRSNFLNELESMIFLADHYRQLLGCSLIASLANEYSISSKSTEIGLTLKQNFIVKEQFELADLKRVFVFCIKALSNMSACEPPFQDTTEVMLKQLLNLAETLLTWNFSGPSRLFSMSAHQMSATPKLKLTVDWKDVILDNKVVNLFYTIYWKVRHIPSLGHLGLTCLVQFASLHGDVFDSEECRFQFVSVFLEGFLKLVQNAAIMDREAIGVSSISREMMSILQDVLMPNLHPDHVQCFLEQITTITCSFAEGAGLEETGRSDDRIFMEAFDNMTEAWLNVLYIEGERWRNLCKSSAMRIFTAYLRCHLAFPAGIRIDQHPDAEEYVEGEEPDRVKFRDQLQNVGEFGRHCLEYSIPWTAKLLDERIDSLSLILVQLRGNKDSADPNQLYPIYEDLNWLLLIAGSIMSYGTSEIPTDMMKYSVSYSVKTHIEFTVYAFMNPTVKMESSSEPEYCVDPVVRLMISVFRLTDLFKRFIDSSLEMFLSPELMSTTLWFLKRFATTYLMFNEQISIEISMPFICTFGRDSEGAVWALNFLLDHLTVFLMKSSAEPDVTEQALSLFAALVDNKEKGRYVLKSEGLQKMMLLLPNLKFGIKREVVKCLTLAGAALPEPSRDCDYWVQILKPVCDRLQSFMKNDEVPRNRHSVDSRREVLDVLDCLIGIATGSTSITTPIIYQYLSPVMIVLPDLMHKYHNYQDVVELILFALVKCATHFVSYLPHMHSKNLYEASLYTIREYSKLNANRLSYDATSEEDSFTDLLLILELLSNLFTKDIFDFSRRDVVEVVERPLVAADVCLFGLSFVMPLVRTELLQYPELSLEYYKLISYVCQFYPAKVISLDEKMLGMILGSIEFGFNATSEEIIPYCCDFIQFLGMHLLSIADGGVTNPVLKPFLKLLLYMTLTHRISDIYVCKTSGALFTMICCYKEDYKQLVQSALDSQPDESVKELLRKAFKDLTENIPLKIHRQSQSNFRRNFENFILEVRGFFTG